MPFAFSDEHFDLSRFLALRPPAGVRRLVLFGAGGWGATLQEELERRKDPRPIVFSDNDRTKWGRRLAGRDIIPPRDLSRTGDLVVITSISAGDAISRQLENLGFVRNRNYFEVMRKLAAGAPLEVLKYYEGLAGGLRGLDILHIGPGGNLGLDVLLAASTGRPVWTVEYCFFRLEYPDVTTQASFYRKLNETARTHLRADLYESGLLTETNGRLRVNEKRVRLLYPCSVRDLPFADDSFDLVLHHAVFEHVLQPERGYREIFRVLKPGGRTAGLVDPQDHRAQAAVEGLDLHPLSYLTMSREEWRGISANINPHNQYTTPEHREALRQAGFDLTTWRLDQRMDIPDEMWAGFHPHFRKWPREEVGVLRFSFVGQKPPK